MSSAQWANIGEDAGALHALLERVRSHVAIEAVDYVWIFPPRKIAIGESVVVVVGAFDEDPERRRVITARFTVSRNRKGAADVREKVDEHGAAPTDAVPRIVQGVLRRLGEDAEAEPRAEQISGELDRWDALIVELGGRPIMREEAGSPGEDASGTGAPVQNDAEGAPAGEEPPPAADPGDEPSAAPADEPPHVAEEAAAALDSEHPEPQR